MLIVAFIWLGIVIFEAVRLARTHKNGTKPTAYSCVKLGLDVFLGLDLLFWGLRQEGLIDLKEWPFILFGVVYFIGLVVAEKLKNVGGTKTDKDKGSDVDEHQK